MAISRKIPKFKTSLKRKLNLIHSSKLEKLSHRKRFKGLHRFYLPSNGTKNDPVSREADQPLMRMSKLFSLKWQRKQIFKAHYIINSESQWNSLFKKADSLKVGKRETFLETPDTMTYEKNSLFISLLESRLDVSLWKSNLVPSLKMSRQLIHHGFIKVNGEKNTKKSTILREGDFVKVTGTGNKFLKNIHDELFSKTLKEINQKTPPFHLEVHYPSLSFIFVQRPFMESIYFFFDPQIHHL